MESLSSSMAGTPPRLLVAVHVTAYRDVVAVEKALRLIEGQSLKPTAIRLVDNSPVRCDFGEHASLEYIHEPANLGTAGAINQSLDALSARSFDYVWILDQDSEPGPALLSSLISMHQAITSNGLSPAGIVAPLTRNRDDGQANAPLFFDAYRHKVSSYDSDPIRCDFIPAAGMLIHLPSVKTITLPSAQYFLDIYDFALGLAVRNAGAGVWLAPSLELPHQVGKKIKVTTGRGSRMIADTPLFRVHLLHRNSTYLYTRSAAGCFKLLAATWTLRRAILYAGRAIYYGLDNAWIKAGAALSGWFLGLFCLRRPDGHKKPHR